MRRTELQKQFFASLGDASVLTPLFDHLPDAFFFVKNRDSLLITGSRNLMDRLGIRRPSDLIGRPDSDFFPEHVVQAFHTDDQRLFRTGKPLINRLEVWYDEQRNLDWFLTTKLPLRDKKCRVIGLMGITRRDLSRAHLLNNSEVARITSYLRQNCERMLAVADVARACGISERNLFRKVREATGITPYELMLRIRVQKAAEALLHSQDKIIEIALDHGFCDQSTFTQHFKKRMGMTPKEFRRRNQAVTS
jgi:AraC-like DNA-binding protein